MAAYLLPEREFGRKELVKFDTIMADYPTFNPHPNPDPTSVKRERHYYGKDTPDGKEYVAMVSGPNSKIQLIRPTLRSANGQNLIRELIKEFDIKRYRDDVTENEHPIEELYLFMAQN